MLLCPLVKALRIRKLLKYFFYPLTCKMQLTPRTPCCEIICFNKIERLQLVYLKKYLRDEIYVSFGLLDFLKNFFIRADLLKFS